MENGDCQCASGKIELGRKCFDTGIFAAIIVSCFAFVVMVAVYFYLQHRRAKNDEAWQVKVEELHFGQHAAVIGQGSFGVVLLAEYRGTQVAIKRVLPMPKPKAGGSRTGSRLSIGNASNDSKSQAAPGSGSVDIEAHGAGADSFDPYTSVGSRNGGCSKSGGSVSSDDELDFLGHLSVGRSRSKWAKLFPWLFPDHDSYNASILGTVSETQGSTRHNVMRALCPWMDANYRRQQEFVVEMRLLSRLRHPCEYTLSSPCFILACYITANGVIIIAYIVIRFYQALQLSWELSWLVARSP